MLSASTLDTTASMGTSHRSEIFRFRSSEIIRSERHTMTSGWMPRLRSSVTECWVGLVFCSPDGPRYGHQGEVDVGHVVPAHVAAELPDRLDEREDLDVADRAADLDDDDVDAVGAELVDALLDLVGDVGDDLDRLAQVVAPPLLGDHRRVDAAGGGVGVLVQVLVDEPLVVAEVEVGLPAVLGDEHLPVLEGVHRARVDVDVRVQLAHGDPQAPALEEPAERRGGEALAQRGGHPAGDEDVLGLIWSARGPRGPGPTIGLPPRLRGPSSRAPDGLRTRRHRLDPASPAVVDRARPAPVPPAARGAWRLADSLSGCPTASGSARPPARRASSTVHLGPGAIRRPPTLRTANLGVGLGRHLGQMRDHQYLRSGPSSASAAPTAVAASRPSRRRPRRTRVTPGASARARRMASMVRDSSPPEAALARGRAGSPGLAAEQEGDLFGRAVPLDLDREPGRRHGQVVQGGLDPEASSGAARRRARATAASTSASSVPGRGDLGVEGHGPLLLGLDHIQPGPGLARRRPPPRRVCSRTCAGARGTARGGTGPPPAVRGRPPRSRPPNADRWPRRRARPWRRGSGGRAASGAPPGQGPGRLGQGVEGPDAVPAALEPGHGLEGRGRRHPEGGRVGQALLLRLEPLLLAVVLDAGRFDLGDLVAEQVGLAGPLAPSPPSAPASSVRRCTRPRASSHPDQVHPAEGVEDLALGRGHHQGAVLVLAVQLDQPAAASARAPTGPCVRRSRPGTARRAPPTGPATTSSSATVGWSRRTAPPPWPRRPRPGPPTGRPGRPAAGRGRRPAVSCRPRSRRSARSCPVRVRR